MASFWEFSERSIYAVNAVSYQGVQVEVVSLGLMTSDSLLSVADCYTDLEKIKQDIQKERIRW
jgi:uncharacterized LabA/DUF88 family protein